MGLMKYWTDIKDWKGEAYDCVLMQQLLKSELDMDVPTEYIEEAWSTYSENVCANWMIMPDSAQLFLDHLEKDGIKLFPTLVVVPETHQMGRLTVENYYINDVVDANNGSEDLDFGIQTSADGRVWICINGVAWLRFKPVSS